MRRRRRGSHGLRGECNISDASRRRPNCSLRQDAAGELLERRVWPLIRCSYPTGRLGQGSRWPDPQSVEAVAIQLDETRGNSVLAVWEHVPTSTVGARAAAAAGAQVGFRVRIAGGARKGRSSAAEPRWRA